MTKLNVSEIITSVGSKHEETSGLCVVEIAKLVRKDIAASVKAGVLPAAKYSVRVDKYSMGCSINVRVSGYAFRTMNWDVYVLDGSSVSSTAPARESNSKVAGEVEDHLNAILGQYNKSQTDWNSDYNNTRFHGNVSFAGTSQEWRDLIEAKKAEAMLSSVDASFIANTEAANEVSHIAYEVTAPMSATLAAICWAE